MANETLNSPAGAPPTGPSVTGLVSGIVQDAQELFKQQVALAKAEIKADLRRTVRAVLALAVGAGAAAVAVFLLCDMLVYVLHEVAGLPVWGSYGIVGAAFAALAAVLIVAGVRRFQSFNPLPDQSVEAFKENVRWMTNPK